MRALILVALVACSAGARHTALSTTTASLDAAQVGFVEYDGRRQLDIVAGCTDKIECIAKLARYRTDRATVVTAVIAAYKAVASAWKLDNNLSVANAVAAGVAVEQAIKTLGATP